MYPSEWHRRFGEITTHSARTILEPLAKAAPFSSFFELGCGHAHWSTVAKELGADSILAVDGPWNDAESVLVQNNEYLIHDLSKVASTGNKYDLAVCLEVAEHVEMKFAGNVITTLTEHSDLILFGAAIPGQGGYLHINEQWPSWWAALFDNAGYQMFDVIRPQHWLDDTIHYWYAQNTFLYARRTRTDLTERFERLQRSLYASPVLIDAAYPTRFTAKANYDDLDFRALRRALPSHARQSIRRKSTRVISALKGSRASTLRERN